MARARKSPGPISLILLAAGASLRMRGQDKLLLAAKGEPLLTRSANAALGSRADEIIVVLPKHSARRALLPKSPRLIVAENPNPDSGMGGSLVAGLERVDEGTSGLLIALADMPDIRAGDYDKLIAAFRTANPGAICQLTDQDGRPGHPVLFDRGYLGQLRALKGDTGAKSILRQHRASVVPVTADGTRATLDLDTPEAWQAYRKSSDPLN